MQDETELQRRVCEARHYLEKGFTDVVSVAKLMDRIRASRGGAAADQLLAEMREQWRRRRQWMGGQA